MSENTRTEDESAKLLTIGTVLGGQRGAYADAEAAVDELFRLKEQVSPPAETGDLRMNLVFDIPGPLLPVNYEGVRTGTFSRAKRMLQIQVAVPEGLTVSGVYVYLREALDETVEIAKAYVKRRKVPLSTEALERVVAELVQRLPR